MNSINRSSKSWSMVTTKHWGKCPRGQGWSLKTLKWNLELYWNNLEPSTHRLTKVFLTLIRKSINKRRTIFKQLVLKLPYHCRCYASIFAAHLNSRGVGWFSSIQEPEKRRFVSPSPVFMQIKGRRSWLSMCPKSWLSVTTRNLW